MIAVPVFAAAFAAFAAWMQGGQDQWRQHLNTEITWSRSPVGHFFVKDGFERYLFQVASHERFAPTQFTSWMQALPFGRSFFENCV
jgi:surfactin synthase thioesterase subunit